MGRHKRRHGQAGNKSREDNSGQNSDRRTNYVLGPKENKLFEEYYQGQGIIQPEDWKDFMEKLQQPLPCTFRITGFRSHAKEMLNIIKNEFSVDLMNVEIDGRNIKPTKCLSWYPNELAWQMDLERKLLRHDQTLKRLHRFLVQETESGNISRQETVSMIPPLLLDLQQHSKVLDMCAAPGSKTAQLIEFLHAFEDESRIKSDGFVLANDTDNKRCYLMVHQIGRLLSPNFAVTNMDASNLPKFTLMNENGQKKTVKFDRILCDVPCSGDGTLRKNVDAWQRWTPAAAHGLHNLQIRILRRGMDLLEVGGRIVYSTCSFNPVENEAVIATTLKQMMGAMELVDVSDELPGLIREEGRQTWRVMSKQKEWFEKYEDVPERLRTQITPTSFPLTPEEARSLNLQRCLRILPHKQDTGGFFVAVMVKKCTLREASNRLAATKNENVEKSLTSSDSDREKITMKVVVDPDPDRSSEVVEQFKDSSSSIHDKRKAIDADEDDDLEQPVYKRMRHFGYKEDPFIFLNQHDDMWTPVKEFYGISDDFPFSQLMVRCESGKKRNIYFVSPVIKQLVQQNEDKVKFINLGVKILGRSISKGVDCEFRLVQDGLHILYPYITKRIIMISKNDIVTLLTSENPYLGRMSNEAQQQLAELDQGGCVYVYEPDPSHEGQGPSCRLLLCGWKGKVSCRSFLPKFERGHFLRLCGVELLDKGEKKSEEKNADESVSNSDETKTRKEEEIVESKITNDDLENIEEKFDLDKEASDLDGSADESGKETREPEEINPPLYIMDTCVTKEEEEGVSSVNRDGDGDS